MKILLLIIFSVSLLTLSACSSIGYYLDAVNGHLSILAEQELIKDILVKEDLSSELKSKLVLATKVREFASSEMLLPDNDSYRYYSDIKRPYVVWNVIATEKYSIEAKQWCFLVVGCVSYRGYFNHDDAVKYADELKTQGFDINIAGAQAYSTLGWFDDPLLNTMIQHDEASIVGVIIHELAHQQIYINNDSAFNEAFASSVEIEGVKRWFSRQTSSLPSASQKKSAEEYHQRYKRKFEFKMLLKATQVKLEKLFNSDSFKNSNNKDILKKQVFSDLQGDYIILKKSWQNYNGYDAWMSTELNNAHLALVATYFDKVPAFQAILKSVNYNIKEYYQAVEEISMQDQEQRNKRLIDNQNF